MKQKTNTWEERYFQFTFTLDGLSNTEKERAFKRFLGKEIKRVERKYKPGSDKFNEMVMNAAKFSHELEYPPTEDEELRRDHEAIREQIRQEFKEALYGTDLTKLNKLLK